jgi:predicted DNA-binding protein (UPF0251 family)
VAALPKVSLFKPAGVPARFLEQRVLSVDEYEAVRLVDGEGLSHEEAAAVIGVSRQTLGRVVESGRRTLIGAIADGQAILIEGGTFDIDPDTCARRRAARGCSGRHGRNAGASCSRGDKESGFVE